MHDLSEHRRVLESNRRGYRNACEHWFCAEDQLGHDAVDGPRESTEFLQGAATG